MVKLSMDKKIGQKRTAAILMSIAFAVFLATAILTTVIQIDRGGDFIDWLPTILNWTASVLLAISSILFFISYSKDKNKS